MDLAVVPKPSEMMNLSQPSKQGMMEPPPPLHAADEGVSGSGGGGGGGVRRSTCVAILKGE